MVIRGVTLVGLVAIAMSGCGGDDERQRATVYESRPVAVLPPESAPPPPPVNAVRSTERTKPPEAPTRDAEVEAQAPPTPRTTPRVVSSEAQFPVAKPVPGKLGFVYSPFESNGTMIDVTGYSSGQKVKDPGTNKIFIVP